MATESTRQRPPWLDPQQPRAGRYVLGPFLGQGGLGEVREAWDLVLCRTVALKVLQKLDPSNLLRFMQEARIQGRLTHPNACQVFDVDSADGRPRIAMQLVRGPTLADAAADLTARELAEIMVQVAGAVHAAHQQNLIHRDLKPSNILLERAGSGGWTPYVCDFGLAMEVGEPGLTGPVCVQGTPAYMAPEQLRGERDRIGPATDVFALGGTLSFALRGQVPGSPPVVRAPGAPPPRKVPRDLEHIVTQCMDPEPECRYATAAALAEDLGRFLKGEPVQARPLGPLGRAGRRLRGSWKPALAATLAFACLLALASREHRQLASTSRRRSAWERHFILEAANLERDLQLERELPPHDLRPAYARLRARLGRLQEQVRDLDWEDQGAGHYALGEGRLLLGDWEGARRELELAAARGFQGPEAACLQASALLGAQIRSEPERAFSGSPEDDAGEAARVTAKVEALLRACAGPDGQPGPLGRARVAFLAQDYLHAAELARQALDEDPRQVEAAVLGSLSLSALGCRSGDRLLAEARFKEAMKTAGRCLPQAQSDETLWHAWLTAGRALATVELERDRLDSVLLAQLKAAGDQALRLDPDDQDLQDDWLGIRILEAQRLEAQHRDPSRELDAAQARLAIWVRPPLGAGLRADRMLVQWLRACWALERGTDPEPALARALADPGHTPFLGRDYLLDLLRLRDEVRGRLHRG